MLNLEHILLGVQPDTSRHHVSLPDQWRTVSFSEVVIDSRQATPDTLFVALSGERTDGHRFLSDAAQRGARGALVRQAAPNLQEIALPAGAVFIDPADARSLEHLRMRQPQRVRDGQRDDDTLSEERTFLLIGVDDPLRALQRLALYHRKQLTPTVVGITGSVGKTSTKEVVAAVLRRRFCTLKTQYSYNSEASLPTVVLQLTPQHEVAVMELGMWAPGEIRFLASLCLPQIGVVTNIGPSHLERMGTMEAITDAKAELVEALPPDGVAVLNGDDQRVRSLAARTRARVFTYGCTPGVDLQAESVISRGMQGLTCTLRYQGNHIPLTLPLVGQHSISIALAAAAVGLVLGLSWDEIIAGLQDTETRTRIQFVEAYKSTVIDDTYNASPVSVIAALDLLAELEGYRIAVLGDMLELGSVEEEAHRLVGQRAAQVADHLICLGQRSHTWTADAAAHAGMKQESIHCADQLDHVVTLLRTLVDTFVDSGQTESVTRPIILIKGSRGLEMEKIVHSLGT